MLNAGFNASAPNNSVHMDSIVKTNNVNFTESKNIFIYLRGLLRFLRPSNIIITTIERIAYTNAKHIIAVSSGIKKELMDRFRLDYSKITVIPNGADVEKFAPNVNYKKEIRGKYNIGNENKIILFVGHQFKRKGLDYVINALPHIKEKITLFIVGNDSFDYYNDLAIKLGVLDKIIFIGSVTTGIEKIYAASDIFVFPTAYEAFALVTLEAMASGLPVLATRVNGTDELIKDGINGFFIERNSKDIAEKLNLAFEAKNLEIMSIKSRETSLQYSWDILSQKTLSVIKLISKL